MGVRMVLEAKDRRPSLPARSRYVTTACPFSRRNVAAISALRSWTTASSRRRADDDDSERLRELLQLRDGVEKIAFVRELVEVVDGHEPWSSRARIEKPLTKLADAGDAESGSRFDDVDALQPLDGMLSRSNDRPSTSRCPDRTRPSRSRLRVPPRGATEFEGGELPSSARTTSKGRVRGIRCAIWSTSCFRKSMSCARSSPARSTRPGKSPPDAASRLGNPVFSRSACFLVRSARKPSHWPLSGVRTSIALAPGSTDAGAGGSGSFVGHTSSGSSAAGGGGAAAGGRTATAREVPAFPST